jgi:hypothetical protein
MSFAQRLNVPHDDRFDSLRLLTFLPFTTKSSGEYISDPPDAQGDVALIVVSPESVEQGNSSRREHQESLHNFWTISQLFTQLFPALCSVRAGHEIENVVHAFLVLLKESQGASSRSS